MPYDDTGTPQVYKQTAGNNQRKQTKMAKKWYYFIYMGVMNEAFPHQFRFVFWGAPATFKFNTYTASATAHKRQNKEGGKRT